MIGSLKLKQMADKLTLRGIKHIEKYVQPTNPADRVFSLKRPTTGKDQFILKRWWFERGNRNPKRYVNATCLDATFCGKPVVVAVVGNQYTHLDLNLNDTQDALVFGRAHAVERVAIFSEDLTTLHYDYVMPRIASDKVAIITANPIIVATTIGNVTKKSGSKTAKDGDTKSYSFANDGTASNIQYTLSSSESADVVNGMDVTFNGVGKRSIAVSAVSIGSSDTPNNNALTFNVVVSD